MPSSADLPDEIKTLALRNAMRLSEGNFHRDMEEVIRVIKSDLKGNLTKMLLVYGVPILKGIFIYSLFGLVLTILIAVSFPSLLGWYISLSELSLIFGASVTLVVGAGILLKLVRGK